MTPTKTGINGHRKHCYCESVILGLLDMHSAVQTVDALHRNTGIMASPVDATGPHTQYLTDFD